MMDELDLHHRSLHSPMLIATGLKAQGSLASRSLEWADIEMDFQDVPVDEQLFDEASSIWTEIFLTQNKNSIPFGSQACR